MFINVNNIRLYYEKKGEGNPLILLHGNEENHFIFDEAVEKLKKYYTVYTIAVSYTHLTLPTTPYV